MPASGTCKSSTLTLHHNLQDLTLEASCSLELSEMVINEHKNHEATEEGMLQGLSKDATSSSFGRVGKDGIRTMLKVYNSWSKNSNPHTLVQVGRGLVSTLFL